MPMCGVFKVLISSPRKPTMTRAIPRVELINQQTRQQDLHP
jgi:hypothetical protein